MTARRERVPMLPVAHWTTRYGVRHCPDPLRCDERRLVQHVGGQPHVGGVHQPAVPSDGAHALGLRGTVGRDGLLGLTDLRLGGSEDVVGDGDLAGMDGPLAVVSEQAGVLGRPAVALRVLVRGVRGVDGVDARGPGGAQDLDPGEVPEVPRVLADRVEVAVHPGPQRGGEVAGAEDDRLQPVARPGDLGGVGQSLGLLDQHLEGDALAQARAWSRAG